MEVRRLAVHAPAGVSGDFKGRREDDRLLTGGGRYTADRDFPGQLYACFVRSDRAHADILSLAKENALTSPGVVAIFTGEDTAAFRTPPPMVRFPGRGGAMLKVPHRDILARGRVRHVGQEIALVVATSAPAASCAAERRAGPARRHPGKPVLRLRVRR
jgi:carbon-monoxide dehydrogenase large subunit